MSVALPLASTTTSWAIAWLRGCIAATLIAAASWALLVLSAGHSTPLIYAAAALQFPGSLWWMLIFDYAPPQGTALTLWALFMGPTLITQMTIFAVLYRAPWRASKAVLPSNKSLERTRER
jgi:hypothetical protein